METMPPSSTHMLLSSFTTTVRFGSSERGQQSRATGRMRRRTAFRCRDRKSFWHDYIRANFPVCGIHVHESNDRLAAGLSPRWARTTPRRTSQFAGALKKVNATWLVVGDPSDPDDGGPSRLLGGQRSRRPAIGHPCFAECFGGMSGGKLTHGWRDSSHTARVGPGKLGSAKLPIATLTSPRNPAFSQNTVDPHVGQK
jgi:hypothetical protein